MINQFFKDLFHNQKIGILGFGREGISSYKTLRKYLPDTEIFIFDQSELSPEKSQILASDNRVEIFTGMNYLDSLSKTDVVVKSPGIPTMHIEDLGYKGTIISQSDIFLKLFKDTVIGITGTKGKSTTASLLHHILITAGRKSLLAGNIGVPPLEIIHEVSSDTIVVLEMSSHQLENCTVSPHISVLLNLFEEHLDHYRSYFDYQLAKGNIFKFQSEKDFIIADLSNKEVSGLIKAIGSESGLIDIGSKVNSNNSSHFIGDDLVVDIYGKKFLIEGLAKLSKIPGKHNLKNISAASVAAILCGLSSNEISMGVASFNGLTHRLEYVGEARGVHFYNDSISTIPQATIEALKAFPETTTLIVGGHDRGIDYSGLAEFLPNSNVKTIVFVGLAGRRIFNEVKKLSSLGFIKTFLPKSFKEGFEMALENTKEGGVCLLSPAASSYDEFRNFEHRGEVYKTLVREYAK